ncbi:MAG: YaiI/YqxD family protein [Bacteriovoracaceae bacterium]
MRIFIDADGCPVKDEVYKVAARYKLDVFVVANKPIHVPLHPSIKMQVVSSGPDEADNWIAENIQESDICITTDIPLADRCLKKNARALGARGDEFTEDMIGDALATRELMKHLREMGEMKGGPAAFAQKDRSQFLSSLDRIIQNINRKMKS